ncbi:MAG: ABC transporter substrate-binding protein [Thermonemataceae bacterium]|nr:ABC transporter substrate-binding protein [Thermonemataceae bacterium]
MKKIILIVLVVSFIQPLQAQTKKLTAQYQKAKTFLSNKQYQEAIDEFNELVKIHKNNVYRSYAYYYAALAYTKINKYKEAEKRLEALSEKFPEWNKKEEVMYLQAHIAFEKNEDNIAISYIEKIKDKNMSDEAESMKAYYLAKRDLDLLKNLQAVYPKDKTIAQVLVDKIAAFSEKTSDLDLMDSLVKKYNLEKPSKTRIQKKAKSVYKYANKGDTLHIAVLLPIDFDNFKKGKKNSAANLSVDFYWGMRIAKKHLDSSNIFTKFYVYDVHQNPDTLTLLEKSKEFAQIDMMVGPFYDEDFAKALEIAQKYDIPIINPFLSNSKFLQAQNAYFMQPSIATQGEQAAYFATKKFGKKAIIFYSELTNDLELMKAHKEAFESKGGQILAQQKLSVTTIPLIEEILAKPENKEVNYVFVASSSQAAAEKILEQMKDKMPSVPIITTLAWRRFAEIKPETLEAQNVHFIDPDYTRFGEKKDPFKVQYNFRAKHLQEYYNMQNPPLAAYKGYDFTISFIKTLGQNKNNFFQKVSNNPNFKKTYRGYIFDNKNRDNQYVPILKYDNKKLILANPLEE